MSFQAELPLIFFGGRQGITPATLQPAIVVGNLRLRSLVASLVRSSEKTDCAGQREHDLEHKLRLRYEQ